jgi:hypothetical protein
LGAPWELVRGAAMAIGAVIGRLAGTLGDFTYGLHMVHAMFAPCKIGDLPHPPRKYVGRRALCAFLRDCKGV